VTTPEQRQLARRFFEVIPPLLHSVGSELRAVGNEGEFVTMAQFRTMAALQRGPLSLNAVAAIHEVAAPTMSRLISTLVERGWVSRQPDLRDRRQVLLELTDEGQASWQMMCDRSYEHLAELFEELTSDEVASLEIVLNGLWRVGARRRQQQMRCEP
jgi:DNA-binding MarR family transcriptional regulator